MDKDVILASNSLLVGCIPLCKPQTGRTVNKRPLIPGFQVCLDQCHSVIFIATTSGFTRMRSAVDTRTHANTETTGAVETFFPCEGSRVIAIFVVTAGWQTALDKYPSESCENARSMR